MDSPFCGCWRFARLWLWIWKNVENREIYYLHGAGVFSSLLPVVSATPSCHAAPSRMRLGCYEATTPSPTHPNTMKRAMNKSSSTACQNISFVKSSTVLIQTEVAASVPCSLCRTWTRFEINSIFFFLHFLNEFLSVDEISQTLTITQTNLYLNSCLSQDGQNGVCYW